MTLGERSAKLSPMKYFFFILLSLNFSHASVTGFTEECPLSAQLVANEGDKFVTVKIMGKDEKLTSVSGEPFSLQAKNPVTFRGEDLEFEMTSVVMSSLPRLVFRNAGLQKKCRVNLHGTINQ